MKRHLFLTFSIFLLITNQYVFAQWQKTDEPKDSAICIAIANNGDVFAGTNGGLFLSTDSGVNWETQPSGLSDTILSLAISGANMFAGTGGEGIFISTNNGDSWKAVNNGLTNEDVLSLAVGGNGTEIFAGTGDETGGAGVFLSTNSGDNWITVNKGLPNIFGIYLPVLTLTINGTTEYAGTYEDGIYLSTNNGSSWTGANSGLTNKNVWSIFINGSNIFAGTEGGVFLSTNEGKSWTSENTGLGDITVNSFALSGTNLFAGALGGGVFLSTNNGTNWSAVNEGLITNNVLSLAISGGNILAGTDKGLWINNISEVTGINKVKSQNLKVKIEIYPNPANSLLVVSYSLIERGFVNIKVYDLTGRVVSNLINEEKDKGEYTVKYDASGLMNGVYFVKMECTEIISVAKFVKE